MNKDKMAYLNNRATALGLSKSNTVHVSETLTKEINRLTSEIRILQIKQNEGVAKSRAEINKEVNVIRDALNIQDADEDKVLDMIIKLEKKAF